MVAARISFNGDKASKKLAEMIERSKDLSAPLSAGAAAIKKLIDDSFRNSVSPAGEAWKDLAPSTVEKRRKGSNKPLVDTGILRAAAFARVDGNSIVFGDNMSYAGPQQFGAEHDGVYKPVKKSGPSIGPRSPLGKRAKAGRKSGRTRRGVKLFTGERGHIGPRTFSQHHNSTESRTARAGGSYTVKLPARPFLPVSKDGAFIRSGAAAEVLAKVGEYIRNWVSTGKKSR